MKLTNNISLSVEVLEKITIQECKKIPGFDFSKEVKIEINDAKNSFNIYISPLNIFLNLNVMAQELQQTIYKYIMKEFDALDQKIKVNVYLMYQEEK